MLIVGRDHDLLHVLVLTITKLMVLVFYLCNTRIGGKGSTNSNYTPNGEKYRRHSN